MPTNLSFIKTIKDRCRVCYTCVRECPAKAIRIAEGQAEVIAERCIGCGNCIRVCSQKAKQVISSIDQVIDLLAGDAPVAACLAPSFPAEFEDSGAGRLIGMLRGLGFDYVNEVGFGADLVAQRYREILTENDSTHRYISTSCPAIVGYVEKYHPQLADRLMPVVSPMVATARMLRQRHSSELKVVFIGPCIAKKCEAADPLLADEVDAVLTFAELRQMLSDGAVDLETYPSSDFDEPRAGLGALFPISRGLLQAAALGEDLLTGEVVATDGRTNFVEAIKEFESGSLDARLLEVLACTGCIMGAGMSTEASLFSRRSRVSRYVRARQESLDQGQWQREMESYRDLDLGCRFESNDQRIPVPFEEEINMIMVKMGKFKPEDELNCGACGYDTCREHAIAIFKGLAENEMCLPHTIDQLRETIKKLATSDKQLHSTQEALMQAEKLASMGQLAAGIAHELNNPLGVVLMYTHLLLEQLEEDVESRDDLKMIVEQADRCKKIVSGLLQFARQNKVHYEPINLAELIDQVLKAHPLPEGIEIRIDTALDNPIVEIDPDQIIQVLTNLITNAAAAMGETGRLSLSVQGDDYHVKIAVTDTGHGIKPENLPKLFEPFYTTKQMGKGTGLGLAVAYGIIKMHRGDIKAESNADPSKGPTGSTFTITLQRKGQSPRSEDRYMVNGVIKVPPPFTE